MARVKIKDLPKDKKVSKVELKKIFGGDTILPIDPIAWNQAARSPDWRPPTLDPVAYNTRMMPPEWIPSIAFNSAARPPEW